MMQKSILFSLAAIAVLFNGCAETKKPTPVKWETLNYVYKPQLEACSNIEDKYLKSYSFMQVLTELGEKEGVRFTFTPSSVDVFVENVSFQSWSDALFWLDKKQDYSVNIYGYAQKNIVKTIDISKITPSFFSMVCESKIKKDANTGARPLIGSLKIADDKIREASQEFSNHVKFSDKYLTLERYLNDFYYFFKQTRGKNIYYDYDAKSKTVILSSSPHHIVMTPYKMAVYKNYLSAVKIDYDNHESNKAISINDNFLLWKKAMKYLSSVNKYNDNIYGVKTDEGYYEIADGKYPAYPLAVELITWTPTGEREYNVYYNGESRKVITKERNFVFFTKDSHKKFIVRTF